MLFIILLGIALIGILFFHYKTRKNENKKLLHRIKKSCNIDSVRFEKRLLFLSYFIKKSSISILHSGKLILTKIIYHKNKIVDILKKSIRKKLFEKQEKEKVSDFISEMKK